MSRIVPSPADGSCVQNCFCVAAFVWRLTGRCSNIPADHMGCMLALQHFLPALILASRSHKGELPSGGGTQQEVRALRSRPLSQREQYMYRLLDAAAAMRFSSGCHARWSSLAWKSCPVMSASGAPLAGVLLAARFADPLDSPNLLDTCRVHPPSMLTVNQAAVLAVGQASADLLHTCQCKCSCRVVRVHSLRRQQTTPGQCHGRHGSHGTEFVA